MGDVTRLIEASKALEKATNGRFDFDSAYEAILMAVIAFDEESKTFGTNRRDEIEA